MDVMVEMVLDRHVRTSEAVVSLYDLDVEHLCAAGKNTREHRMKLFLFDVDLPTDAEEDLDLVIQEIVRVPCVLLAVVPDLRELRDRGGVKPVVARPSWWQRLVRVVGKFRWSAGYADCRLLRKWRDLPIRSCW